jgi:acyl-CoA reductase-like NAD-dependent aldehyde dehydrogenase
MVLAGGERAAGDGYFLPPTIVTQLPEDARLITEEQFGPVLPVQHFSDIEDAIRRATAANVPFGGIKQSGIGRNYSELGLKGNMEARVISVLKSQAP